MGDVGGFTGIGRFGSSRYEKGREPDAPGVCHDSERSKERLLKNKQSLYICWLLRFNIYSYIRSNLGALLIKMKNRKINVKFS